MARASSLSAVLKAAAGGDFVLVELTKEGPKPCYDGEGQLMTFKDGATAAKEAERQTDLLGNKVQPRRAVDDKWRERETKKMGDGTYQKLPWADEPWWAELAHVHGEHFPHVSLGKTTLIAFTEDAFKGSADLQTAMKPGRYLERYFTTVLNKHVIRDLCCIFAKQFEDNKLQFADDPDMIEEVFTTGPSSCMSKEKDAYRGVHPTRMYAAGDLQVAYMRREGRIVARSVVWPEKKTYNVIYGDKGRLETLLQKAGYKSGVPYGARLLKHKIVEGKNYRFSCPHVDGASHVRDGGEFLIVGDKSRKEGEGFEVPGGGGFTEALGYKCTGCDKDTFASRHIVMYYVGETERTAHMCLACQGDRLVMCELLGSYIEKSAAVQVVGKNRWGWTKHVKNGQLTLCSGSGKFANTGAMVLMPDGSRWSQEHFMSAGRNCNHCGGGYAKAAKVCPRCEGGTLRSSITQQSVEM